MKMLKSKATIALIVMVLGVSYIGGIDNSNFSDSQNFEQSISENA